MLSFFRRALGSWIVVALLGLVMVAFIVTGVGNPGGLGGSVNADAVASVGGEQVLAADVARRAQSELAQARQRQPDLTMAQFLASGGGVGAMVEQYVTGRMLQAWATRHGLVASDRLVDGEIAGIPAFQGPTGAFDERQMQALLAQQHMTLPGLREGIRGDLLRRQLLVPITAAAAMPRGLADAYAGLMIARRTGLVGFVPAQAAAVPSPGAADVAMWYKAHLASYSLPERRVIRYAPIAADTVAVDAPTDAEIAGQYRADAAKYAATETRALSQVVLPDEAAAKAFAAKVAAGTPFARAAAEAGFAAADISVGKVAKPAFATSSSLAIADAAFAARQGATTAPIKSVLGWTIVHVDAIAVVGARSLDQARGEIVDALTKKRRVAALSALGQRIEDALADGATFDEIAKANALAIVATPPLTANGAAPADPAYKPDAAVTALLKPAFQASPDDRPTLETVAADRFALLALGPITAAAPLPLDQVRARVTADLVASRAAAAARATAQAIVDKANAGTPLATALAAAGQKPPVPANASEIDVSRLAQVPPPLRILFTLAPGRAGLVGGPGGWFVVQLARIEEGPQQMRGVVATQLKTELDRAAGDEWLEQFARAARAEITVKRNPAAIAALGRQLTGQAPADGQ